MLMMDSMLYIRNNGYQEGKNIYLSFSWLWYERRKKIQDFRTTLLWINYELSFPHCHHWHSQCVYSDGGMVYHDEDDDHAEMLLMVRKILLL